MKLNNKNTQVVLLYNYSDEQIWQFEIFVDILKGLLLYVHITFYSIREILYLHSATYTKIPSKEKVSNENNRRLTGIY